MKKAVLYARVSSDLQKKERTIESQITALKSQINEAGDVLVKEYVDDGYSGARLDRPALDEGTLTREPPRAQHAVQWRAGRCGQ
jgi:DNA invertase Pin-like site-specific DNA recombinase